MAHFWRVLGQAVPDLARLIVLVVALAPLQPFLYGQQPPVRKAPPGKVPPKAAATPAAQPSDQKFKGIWEPVN